MKLARIHMHTMHTCQQGLAGMSACSHVQQLHIEHEKRQDSATKEQHEKQVMTATESVVTGTRSTAMGLSTPAGEQ
jgi:hypothetical protein